MAAMVELILLSRINAKALWKAISNLCIDPTAPADIYVCQQTSRCLQKQREMTGSLGTFFFAGLTKLACCKLRFQVAGLAPLHKVLIKKISHKN